MPEIVVKEQAAQTYPIPSFLVPKMPAEVSNESKPEAPQPAPESAAAPTAPAAEAKPESAPETPPEAEVQEEAKEPGQETTEKDQAKATTRRFERRIDRAIRARAEAQARAELLEKENASLKERLEKPAPPSSAPKMEDYTDVQEYAKAYATYEKSQAIKEYENRQNEERVKGEQKKLTDSWDTKVSAGISKYDDFEEVVGELKPTTPWAIALMQEDNGADIAHYLGTHERDARRIFDLDPYGQIREIGKLSVKLAQTPEPKKAPSKAPPPIAPVAGGGNTAEPAVNEQMPFEQYMKVGAKMFRGR